MFNEVKTPADASAAAQRLIDADALLFDSETTGMSKKDQIIQLAFVNTRAEVVFAEYFKPSVPVSQHAYKVHRISDQKLRKEFPVNVYMDRLLHVTNDRTIIAFNSPFDVRMLKQTLKAHQLTQPINARVSDLLKLYAIFRGTPWLKTSQANAALELGLGTYGAHDAVADALMANEILWKIAEHHTPTLIDSVAR